MLPDGQHEWEAAEHAAMVYMRRIGMQDAILSGGGADGGIDVKADNAAAQVKAHAKPIGRPDIQRLVGATVGVDIKLFFSLSGYSSSATTFANEAGVCLFKFDADLVPYPVNDSGHQLARAKWAPRPTDLELSAKSPERTEGRSRLLAGVGD